MTKVLACPPHRSDMVIAVHSPMDLDELIRRRCSEPTPGPLQPMRHLTDSAMRERSSSMNELNASHTQYDVDVEVDVQEQMRMNSTASIIDPTGFRDTICMCVQAPRIPRPRNAFILYRQYHQSHVMSENPSLSNPEISRIIGEKWKNEDLEVKEDWKKLAEKEKQRHANKYPNYRYQPRRSVKPQGWTASTLEEDQGRCPKCKGRLTSLTPRRPADPEMSPVTPTRMGITQTPQMGPRSSLDRLNTDVPRWWSIGSASPIVINRLPLPNRPVSFVSPEGDAMSPDSKRRRTSSMSDYHLVSGQPDAYAAGMSMREPRRVSQEAGGWKQDFAQRTSMETSLPEIGSLPRLGPLPMPPPPRPSETWGRHEQDNGGSRSQNSFDESLRLPPLRNSDSPGPRSNAMSDGRLGRPIWDAGSPDVQHDQARVFVGSDMMTISYRLKLSILAKVCRPAPPLSSPFPSPVHSPPPLPSLDRPSTAIRGAFIAIEGSEARMLRDIGLAVERGLTEISDIRLRVWRSEANHSFDTATPSRQETFMPANVSRMHFETIERGQEISQQVVHHITTAGEDSNHSSHAAGQSRSSTEVAARTPVALVKNGFSLTLTDKLVRATANSDNYSPLDHWKWMASLWRGTACPDLVVYVKPSDVEETNQLGSVEVWKQIGLLVVRVSPDKGLHESVEKRLLLEVRKWIQEGAYRDPVAPDWRAE